MSTTFIGTGIGVTEEYGIYEERIHILLKQQIEKKFPNDENLLISTTWFGPTFNHHNDNWEKIINNTTKYHNVFLISTIDMPMIGDNEIRDIKEHTNALHMYLIGHFDTQYQYNFFAPILAERFVKYSENDIILKNIDNIFVNYNRKPYPHRVEFVQMLIKNDLMNNGIVTLGRDKDHVYDKDDDNNLYFSLNEKHKDWEKFGNNKEWQGFDIPLDYFSLHRMDIWNSTFLYINAATEFKKRNELFCQQDVFKPLIGMRPYVINGVQKTYHWLRYHGFKTFNHYWKHIDIENGDVHETLIELVKFLNMLGNSELLEMYNDMIPDLRYNKERFFEFAYEQTNKIENIFE